jgi:outer membrane protein OmpA-like peptidoglycan-associated protein
MTFRKYICFFFGMLYFVAPSTAQKGYTIDLRNPSFEDLSRCCKPPRGWEACGKEDLNTPDVQPGWFSVDLEPFEGNTYIGLVTRDNDSWESISQRLNRSLKRGECYTFSFKASYGDKLTSQSRITGKDVKYTKPIKIRIWGGTGYCHKAELLAETPLIDHNYWKQFNFRFEPRKSHSFITIEAFYKTPTLVPYNGNVLIDDASSILIISCKDEAEPEVVDVEQPQEPLYAVEEPTPPVVNTRPPTKSNPTGAGTQTPPKEEKVDEILEVKKKDLKKGQVLRIENLYFQTDSSKISQNSYAELDKIYNFLRSNSEISIEVGGHTNGNCDTKFCNELSEKRAQAVAYYLIGKGISSKRLKYKGYGKAKPLATNSTPSGRKRNQRVEIKILSLNG